MDYELLLMSSGMWQGIENWVKVLFLLDVGSTLPLILKRNFLSAIAISKEIQ